MSIFLGLFDAENQHILIYYATSSRQKRLPGKKNCEEEANPVNMNEKQ